MTSTPEGLMPTAPGKGKLPFREILKALAESGRQFPLTLEFGTEGNPKGEIEQVLRYLKGMAPEIIKWRPGR